VTAALVTGATAGIGRAFVTAFAHRRTDLVLVARDGTRLEALAAELRTGDGIAVEVLAADLGADDGVATVERRLRDASSPVDVLVNNAGMATYGDFVDLDPEREVSEIQLNVLAVVRLTHAALGPMTARGSGAVLNVSSLAAYQPVPSSATYAATKAFVSSFTQAVHQETRGRGVHVMLVCPGFTHTEFHERAGLGPTALPEFVWQSPEQVVDAAMRDLDRRRAVSIPGGLNRTLSALSSMAPAGLAGRVAGAVQRRVG
jgi:hypothetical protein